MKILEVTWLRYTPYHPVSIGIAPDFYDRPRFYLVLGRLLVEVFLPERQAA